MSAREDVARRDALAAIFDGETAGSPMIVFTDTDGQRSMRLPMSFELADALLASPWLAEHDAEVRAAERERRAQAIEDRASVASYVETEEVTDTYLEAARIAREATS